VTGFGGRSRTTGYVIATGVDGVSCDTTTPLALMADELSARATVQGNLDPLLLVAGGKGLERRTHEILTVLNGKRFIFNLGHGIVPETPPENVGALVDLLRGYRAT